MNVPKNFGIYIIFDKKGIPIYVGRTSDLNRRLFGNHRSGDVMGSAFRKALSKKLSINDEKKLRKYIEDNCSFKYLLLKNPNGLEHFLISVLSPELNT